MTQGGNFEVKVSGNSIAIGLVAIAISVSIALTVPSQVKSWGMDAWQALFPPQPIPVVEVKSLIINGLQGSTVLDTADLYTETVVTTSQDRMLGQLKLGDTKLIYQAAGTVRAGIDLSKLEAKNVNMKNGSIHILLPPPHILDASIDVTKSGVLDHHKNWFGPDVEVELQEEAQRKALQQIKATACAKNLLKMANDQAEKIVRLILTTAGYKDIVVETQLPESGTCPSS